MNENGRIDIIENCAANKYMLQQEKRQNISAMTVYVIPPAPAMDESAISRVAPRTGAWIEISCLDNAITSFSAAYRAAACFLVFVSAAPAPR